MIPFLVTWIELTWFKTTKLARRAIYITITQVILILFLLTSYKWKTKYTMDPSIGFAVVATTTSPLHKLVWVIWMGLENRFRLFLFFLHFSCTKNKCIFLVEISPIWDSKVQFVISRTCLFRNCDMSIHST